MEQGKLQAQRHQQFKGPVIKCLDETIQFEGTCLMNVRYFKAQR